MGTKDDLWMQTNSIYSPLGYERVHLLLYQVADAPFYIQGDDTDRGVYRVYARLPSVITIVLQKLFIVFF